MIRYTILLTVAFYLTGCGSLKPTQLNFQPDDNATLVVTDNRPQNQAKTEMLSYLSTSCNYGIQRLGDELTVPNKVEFLKYQLSKQFPEAKSLVIDNFVIYNNMQYQLREGNIFRGEIWSLIECDKNTDRFTMYTPEENPLRQVILIGTFEGSIDGTQYIARSTEIPRCPKGAEKCDASVARDDAIKKILDDIIVQIANETKKPI